MGSVAGVCIFLGLAARFESQPSSVSVHVSVDRFVACELRARSLQLAANRAAGVHWGWAARHEGGSQAQSFGSLLFFSHSVLIPTLFEPHHPTLIQMRRRDGQGAWPRRPAQGIQNSYRRHRQHRDHTRHGGRACPRARGSDTGYATPAVVPGQQRWRQRGSGCAAGPRDTLVSLETAGKRVRRGATLYPCLTGAAGDGYRRISRRPATALCYCGERQHRCDADICATQWWQRCGRYGRHAMRRATRP